MIYVIVAIIATALLLSTELLVAYFHNNDELTSSDKEDN